MIELGRASEWLALALLLLPGCNSKSSAATVASATPSANVASSAPAPAAAASNSLKGICPDKIVIQTDWFATPERAAAYQLAGPNGTVDKKKGSYTGPLGDTGVTIEVRLGGPFIGFQPIPALMYQDPSIYLGYVATDDAVQAAEKFPTMAVVAPLDINPQILMWDPETYTINGWSDVATTKAKIIYIEGLPFMDYLVSKGFVKASQKDASFDGTPSRFVAERGKLIQQGYASNEPYRWEHDVETWKKPVKFLLVHDSGYEIYPQGLAVRQKDLGRRQRLPQEARAADPEGAGRLHERSRAHQRRAGSHCANVGRRPADHRGRQRRRGGRDERPAHRRQRPRRHARQLRPGARRPHDRASEADLRRAPHARRRRPEGDGHRDQRVHRRVDPPVTKAADPHSPVDLLIAGARLVATCDDQAAEIAAAGSPCETAASRRWAAADEPQRAVGVDASGCLVTPGLVNAHHHLWQNLTRAYRPMTTTDFLGWLGALYPLWSRVDVEAIRALDPGRPGRAGARRLHHDERPPVPAAAGPTEPGRGRDPRRARDGAPLSRHARLGRSRAEHGSPMPDHMLESVDDVLADSARLVATYHERGPDAMMQVALGPHSVFGATSELMREAARLAERLDVRLHTHLSGDRADERYCLDLHGCRPVEWFESLGWASPRTWVAHCFFPNDDEIARLCRAGVGVAHCATAGLLMGVGVAPVVELRRAGVPVGLGVDGSSNSDSSSMWLEARMAMIANRFRSGPAAFGARDALEMATRGARLPRP